MFYTYVLQGEHKRLYVGYSADLKTRIKKHFNKGYIQQKEWEIWN